MFVTVSLGAIETLGIFYSKIIWKQFRGSLIPENVLKMRENIKFGF